VRVSLTDRGLGLVNEAGRPLDVPVEFGRDAEGLTARVPVPDAPDGAMVEYRFDTSARLLGEDIPLARGLGEEALASLRAVVDRGEGGPLTRTLRGEGAQRFRIGGIDGRGADLVRDLPGGFTVTEAVEHERPWSWPDVLRRFPIRDLLPQGVRRHYAPGGGLRYRDLPLGPGKSLRVGAGGREGIVRVVGLRGDVPAGWQAERLDGGRVVAVPTAWDHLPEGERPLTHIVVDPRRGVAEETLGVHAEGAELPSWYWRLDYASDPATAVPMRLDGTELPAERLVRTPDGLFQVVRDGQVLLDRAGWDVVADRPVEERIISELPLSGRELAGKVLRTVETGEGPAGRHLVVVDPSAADRPTGWQAAERYDRLGVRISNEAGDRRWYLTPDHNRIDFQLDFQEVRLAGTDRYVQFSADGRPQHVAEANGDPVGTVDKDGKFKPTEYRLEPVTDESEQLTGWTVRAIRDVEPGRNTAWHFDAQMRHTGTTVRPELRPDAGDPGKLADQAARMRNEGTVKFDGTSEI
jgi:hypothetical protein